MKKTLWVLVLVALLGLLGQKIIKKPYAQVNGPIKVASLLSLTGGASAWGENAKKGIDLAVEEINRSGGINGRLLEITHEDTASDPKQTVSAFQRIVAMKDVVAHIGPLNQTELASVIPLIEQNRIPSVVPGYLPLKDRVNLTNPVLIWTDAELEARKLADYVFAQGIRKIGIIGTLDAWEQTITKGFADRFSALGGTVTALEIVQPDSVDMKLSVTKVIGSKPDAIYLGTYYQFVNSVKEISTQGFKGKLYGIEVDDYLAGETSKWTNGLEFIAPDYYSQSFIKKFNDKYGTAPGIPAGQAYDATFVLASFLKTSVEKDKILGLMKNFSEYDGASGKLVITDEKRSLLPLAIFRLQAGKITRVDSLQ